METFVQIVTILALVSVIIVLISQNRHPVSTLAWILILCLLPGLGLVLYYVFGTHKKKSRLVKDGFRNGRTRSWQPMRTRSGGNFRTDIRTSHPCSG